MSAPNDLEDGDEQIVERRRVSSVFIALFLLSQIALPLSYYVSADPFDERFAWRMFSPMRMVSCRVIGLEGTDRQPMNIRRELTPVWYHLMQRGRLEVLDAFANYRCHELDRDELRPELRLSVICRMPDGEPYSLVDGERNLCEEPLL